MYRRLAAVAIVLTLGGSTLAEDLPPLGPSSKIYRGQTSHTNELCNPFPGCQAGPVFFTTNKNVLALIVDTNDHPYTGSQPDLTAYRNTKENNYQLNMNDYWLETSWGMVCSSSQ